MLGFSRKNNNSLSKPYQGTFPTTMPEYLLIHNSLITDIPVEDKAHTK